MEMYKSKKLKDNKNNKKKEINIDDMLGISLSPN